MVFNRLDGFKNSMYLDWWSKKTEKITRKLFSSAFCSVLFFFDTMIGVSRGVFVCILYLYLSYSLALFALRDGRRITKVDILTLHSR